MKNPCQGASLMVIDALLVAGYASVADAEAVLAERAAKAKTEGALRKVDSALASLRETGRIDPDAQKAAYAAQKPQAAPVAAPVAAPADDDPLTTGIAAMKAAGFDASQVAAFVTAMTK